MVDSNFMTTDRQRTPARLLVAIGLFAPYACGERGSARHDSGQGKDADTSDALATTVNVCQERSAGYGGGPAGLVSCSAPDGAVGLCGAPLLFNATVHGFGLNVVLSKGSPAALSARVRAAGTSTWASDRAPEVRATDVALWTFDGLDPGTRYEFEVSSTESTSSAPLYTGSATTQRQAGDTFTFALISDSHIGPDATWSNQGDWCTLAAVSTKVAATSPDFVMNLGDMLDFHQFGFDLPPPDGSYTRQAYLNYRALLGDTLAHAAHYPVIGNWEGENGSYTEDEISFSRDERLLYLPGPSPTTYPESGSPNEDYYAFSWGDALFIALNVMTYTTTEHRLSYDPGVADDWTLGENQLAWFTTTLANATAKWKFVFIHHPVGGAAGDSDDSAYGRGGGQAAYVGEQAKVHQLMLQYGVQIFFYGHDHVFTDMQVDGIHYSEPGSAGAIWMFSSSETGYQKYWAESGWGRVTGGPNAVDVQFLSMDGELLYAYALN